METLQIASLAAPILSAVAAGIAAVGIWYGISAMVRSNKDRRDALVRQREAEDRRHGEAMAQQREFAAQQREALAQQREAEDRRHGEAMAQQREFAAQQREALAQQREAEDRRHEEAMAALKELIRRTAAPGSGTGE